MDASRDVAQHLLGNIQAPDLGLRLLLLKHTREAAFAAADIQHTPAAQIAQMLPDQFHMVDAGIDGGGKMLLVGRCLVERGLDAGAQLGGEPRALRLRKEMLPVHGRVRKMGKPNL